MTYRIIMTVDGKVCWPFWPFRLKRTVIYLPEGFKIEVAQADGSGTGRFSPDPIVIEGHLSSDQQTITTTVDFKEGSRLKRVTKRG